MGHASRCIPLIRYLRSSGHHVTVCARGHQAALIRRAVGEVDLVRSAFFPVRWGKAPVLSLLYQAPAMLGAIRSDRYWLGSFLKKHPQDLVISDNRFGFYHPSVPCIFITHQLHPRLPRPWKPAQNMAARIHARSYRSCDQIWVPDLPGSNNLSGALSHPPEPGNKTRYIGLLSRFPAGNTTAAVHPFPGYRVIGLLSGPEPARSRLERILRDLFLSWGRPSIILQGKPGNEDIKLRDNLLTVPHLEDAPLQKVLEESDLIICRPGYSSLMDLMALSKTAVLVPTPGQSEQEYLARHAEKTEGFTAIRQSDLPRSSYDDFSGMHHRPPVHSFQQDFREIEKALSEIQYQRHGKHTE